MVNGSDVNETSQNQEVKSDTPIDNAEEMKSAPGREEDMGFRELYEKSLQTLQLGEVVEGKVIQINPDMVMVDVGWKTEGYIPAKELRDEQGNISIAVGDRVEVFVDRRDGDGNLVLSKDKAARLKIWDDVKYACENSTTMKGVVVERVKGGLSVDIGDRKSVV